MSLSTLSASFSGSTDFDDELRWSSCTFREFSYERTAMESLSALPWRRVHLWVNSVQAHEVVVGKIEVASALLGFTTESVAAITHLISDFAVYDFARAQGKCGYHAVLEANERTAALVSD